MITIDAHCHTDCSDGSVTIEERIAMIKRCGFDAGTITDHDFVSSEQIDIARKAAGNMPFIPGIELSLSHEGRIVHILGYFVDPENGHLGKHLSEVQEHDRDLTGKLIRAGRTEGIRFSLSDLESSSLHTFYSGQFLKKAAREHCGSDRRRLRKLFFSLLEETNLSYPSFSPWSVRKGIELIHAAGGLAVLAHPGCEEDPLMKILGFRCHKAADIRCYADWGLDGVETHTPVHSLREKEMYSQIAENLGLMVTGGSDCHGNDDFLGPALMGVYTDFPENVFESLWNKHEKPSEKR